MQNERGTRTPSMEVDALSKRGKTVSKGKDIVRCPICSRFGHSSFVVFETKENAKANVERCSWTQITWAAVTTVEHTNLLETAQRKAKEVRTRITSKNPRACQRAKGKTCTKSMRTKTGMIRAHGAKVRTTISNVSEMKQPAEILRVRFLLDHWKLIWLVALWDGLRTLCHWTARRGSSVTTMLEQPRRLSRLNSRRTFHWRKGERSNSQDILNFGRATFTLSTALAIDEGSRVRHRSAQTSGVSEWHNKELRCFHLGRVWCARPSSQSNPKRTSTRVSSIAQCTWLSENFYPCAAREIVQPLHETTEWCDDGTIWAWYREGKWNRRATTIVAKVLAGASGVRLKEIVQTETWNEDEQEKIDRYHMFVNEVDLHEEPEGFRRVMVGHELSERQRREHDQDNDAENI